jgi:urocanate hydratase
MLHWDVTNGVARRAWARNNGAIESIKRAMEINTALQVTIPHKVDVSVLDSIFGSG